MKGWYPENKKPLLDLIKNSLCDQKVSGIKSLIVPHAGYRFCSRVLGKTFGLFEKNLNYDKIFVIGPSHFARLNVFATVPSFKSYYTPLGECSNETETINILKKSNRFEGDNNTHSVDHSIQALIPYIQHCIPDTPIIPIIIGNHPLNIIEEIAFHIKSNMTENSLLIISSDFTHYGERFKYTPFGDLNQTCLSKIKSFDIEAIKLIMSFNTKGYSDYIFNNSNTICGKLPMLTMLKILESDKPNSLLTDYYNSYFLTKYPKNCVSYSGMVFYD